MPSSRFDHAPEDVVRFVEQVRAEKFDEHLRPGTILVLFDEKRRKHDGRIVFGRVQKTNDLTALLTANDDFPDGADFILYLDKAVWMRLDDLDRARIVRHELRHCAYSETDRPITLPHEIEDFYAEVSLNSDDPEWKRRLADVAAEAYLDDGTPAPLPDPNQMDLFDPYLDQAATTLSDKTGKVVSIPLKKAGAK